MDITVSDPWSDEMIETESKGRSAIMAQTERGIQAVTSAINHDDMTADSITVDQMIDYNKHLVVDSKHPQRGWMAGYQLLFFGRIKYLTLVLWSLLYKKRIGLRTTLKALINNNYYN